MNTVANLTVRPEPGHHHCGPRHRLNQQPRLAGQQCGRAAVVDTLCGVRLTGAGSGPPGCRLILLCLQVVMSAVRTDSQPARQPGNTPRPPQQRGRHKQFLKQSRPLYTQVSSMHRAKDSAPAKSKIPLFS